MKFDIWITAKVFDKDGNIIFSKRKKAHSYVQALIGILDAQMAAASKTVKDTSGTNQTFAVTSAAFRANAGAGITTYGIQVGTGTGAVVVTDYRIYPLIAQGIASGNLQYGANSVDTWAVVGTKAFFNVSRTLANNSSGTVNITEVGLVVTDLYYFWLVERTLLSFSIPNGGSSSVNYEISVSV
jgi:hypothetical protein